MRQLLGVVRYEFRMQRRSAVLWLVAAVLLAFFLGEVRPNLEAFARQATAEEPILWPLADGRVVDIAAQAREALALARFSQYAAWHVAERLGLIAGLFVGFLAAFVWQRDRQWELAEVIHARPVASWQVVLGKYTGVALAWALLLLLAGVLSAGWTYALATQGELSFSLADFFQPLLLWIGISLLYGSALVLLLSLLLRGSLATLLVYFFYWVYSITDLGMFQQVVGRSRFLTYWLFRFDYGLDRAAYLALQQRTTDVLLNRMLYAGLSLVLLWLLVRAYDRFRRRGSLFGSQVTMAVKPAED